MSEPKHVDIDHTCFEHLMKPRSKRSAGSRFEGISLMSWIQSGNAGISHRIAETKQRLEIHRQMREKLAAEVTVTDGTQEKAEEK